MQDIKLNIQVDSLNNGLYSENIPYFQISDVRAIIIDKAGVLGDSGMVYVGGRFKYAGSNNLNVNNVAKWNPISQKWSSLNNGLDGSVYSLVIGKDQSNNSCLYAGGTFKFGDNYSKVAKWLPNQGWSPMETSNTNQIVFSLLIYNRDNSVCLIAGGLFNNINNISANNIAIYDINMNQWFPISINSLTPISYITTLVADNNNNLYAGGNFRLANGDNIAKYNFTTYTWESFCGGIGNSTEYMSVSQ